jgi:EmrB/QacA subfamily drug resistance transporter
LLSSARQYRVSLIIASALFMENLDSTIIATALPSIARSLDVEILRLNLAITAYLLSLAVFIPLSGWIADRFGARKVFRTAIALFTVASMLCAVSTSLEMLVGARILQGMGGAMMTPVGRLIILRSVPKSNLVAALAYLTTPALIGPILGPPLGGLITTFFSWHWIFLINVPIGIIGIWLATRYMDDIAEMEVAPLDLRGSVLSGLGLAGLVFGFETVDRGVVPPSVTWALLSTGAALMILYVMHARRAAHPIVDLNLLKIPSFRWTVTGGFVFRVAAGSLQILMPLLFQVGFGMSALSSGLVTFATALGAMPMKALAPRILRRFGFRKVMIGAAIITAGFILVYTMLTPMTPVAVMFLVLFLSGLARSILFTSLNAIAYADVTTVDMSKATSFVSMTQQLSVSIGVATGAFILHQSLVLRGAADLGLDDFLPTFCTMAALMLSSVLFFLPLSASAGAEISGKRATAEAKSSR